MKKILVILLIGCLSLITLTGCGDSEKKVTCTTKLKEENSSYGTSEIIAVLDKDNNVKSVKAEMTINDKKTAEGLYDFYKIQDENAEDESKKLGVSIDKNKVTIDHFELLYGQNELNINLIGMNKKDFINTIESNAQTKTVCK